MAASPAPAHTEAAGAPGFAGYGSKSYRAYVLGMLLLVYTFNFIDRTVISIVQEPIKQEFGLSDLQLGLLGGPAFALLYTLLGIPIARLAERHNRMTILSVCLAVWSGFTALCGVAGNYLQLFAARVGVSVGEAGCTPPAQSVIADYFPADRRATALSVYSLGVPIGSMIAAVGGGWIATEVGWRQAFILLGLPGILLALLVKASVREPPRAGSAATAPGFGETLRVLSKKPAFWHMAMGGAITSFVGYGVGGFLPPFLMRVHGLTLLEASQFAGVILGAAAAVGTFMSGFLADRIAKRHPNALAWLPALGLFIATPLFLGAYFAPTLTWAIAPMVIGAMCQYFYLGPMYTVAQGVVSPRMRATATAILLFIVNMIGYALGPPFIGAVSDLLANQALAASDLSVALCGKASEANAAACAAGQAQGLQYAMMIGVCFFLWAAAHFMFVARTLQRDTVS
ncbi:MAG: MFS transporter [Hyphomonadaceae bacterium]|nr:MFS transporter [Hyphomonadaceae bacterium]